MIKKPGLLLKKGLLALGALCVSITATAESAVWKVSKGEDYLYLAGTVHVLRASDYPLPREF